jgi:hypothetical protein
MRKNRFKEKFISDKIQKLEHENSGRSHEQNIAIAYSMFNNKYPDGGQYPAPSSSAPPPTDNSRLKNIYSIQSDVYNPKLGHGVKMFYRDPNDPKFNPEVDTEFVNRDAYHNMVMRSEQYKQYLNRGNAPFTPTEINTEQYNPNFAAQKPIADIKYNISTGGKRQGLPEGIYTRVTYKDGTFDYLNPKGEDLLKKMNNYRIYQESKFQSGGNFSNNNLGAPKDKDFTGLIDNYQMETPDERQFRNRQDSFNVADIPQFEAPSQNTSEKIGNTYMNQPMQFINPYGGVDLDTASGTLGQSIANKNPLGIAGSAMKLTMGLGRNIMSGLANEKRVQEDIKTYYDNQRDLMTGNKFFQDGGENVSQSQSQSQSQDPTPMIMQALQQGAQPEQIVQQLVQMGMPEQQAIQMLQQVLNQALGQSPQEEKMEGQYSNPQEEAQEEAQQFKDGGEFLNFMKGKRLVNYSFDPESNNYIVDYE